MEAGDTEFLRRNSQALDLGTRTRELGLARRPRTDVALASQGPLLLRVRSSRRRRSRNHPHAHQKPSPTASRTTLEGLKENVIVSRLIPAGTGGQLRRYQKLAMNAMRNWRSSAAKMPVSRRRKQPNKTTDRKKRPQIKRPGSWVTSRASPPAFRYTRLPRRFQTRTRWSGQVVEPLPLLDVERRTRQRGCAL